MRKQGSADPLMRRHAHRPLAAETQWTKIIGRNRMT